jgi:hypothetical protein
MQILPNVSVPYISVATVSKPYLRNGKKVTDINYKYVLKASELPEKTPEKIKTKALEFDLKIPQLPTVDDIKLKGWAKRTLEVDTMQIVSESSHLEATYLVWSPDGWLDSTTVEDALNEYTY